MKEIPSFEKTAIEPDSLIGTKWVGWPDFIGDRIKVEFVDKINCIYTSSANKYPLTYAITEGNLLISEIEGPFELSGNVLFNAGFPTFEKAA